MRYTRLVVLFGGVLVVCSCLTSCGEKGAISNMAPTAQIAVVNSDSLPVIDGLSPPNATPPDSIVAKAEAYFRNRQTTPFSLYVAGVSGYTIASVANSWLGVPYYLGGNTRSGIDCSWLVYQVYHGAGITSYPYMPTAKMKTYGHFICVNWSNDPGDIVLFGGLGHTGIYMGGGWMVDANSYYAYHKVMWDNLNDPYWQQFHPYPVRYVP